MADLVTLDAVKRVRKITSTDTSDDAIIKQLITEATRMVHQYCQREFLPVVATRLYDAVSSRVLELDADLLELTTLTNGDTTVIPAGQVVLQPNNTYPKNRIVLKQAAPFFTYTDDPLAALSVLGVWGYHESYTEAWIDTLDTVQDNPLTAGATSITVADADGLNARGMPRFEVLQYCKIESEVTQVTAYNTSTNVLTVRRAQLGTTAAAHVKTTAIRSFVPQEDIALAAAQLVGWLYMNKESLGRSIQFLDGAILRENEAPTNIRTTLKVYQWGRAG